MIKQKRGERKHWRESIFGNLREGKEHNQNISHWKLKINNNLKKNARARE